MPKVEIVNLGATHNRKPLGEVGDVVEVDEKTAAAMQRYGLAKPAEDEPKADEPDADENSDDDNDESQTGENPAENREKATSEKAAKRETRNADK